MDDDLASASVGFLFAELHTGLTFAEIALSASGDDPGKLERNRENARKAYDSLLRFQGRTVLSAEEAAELETGKEKLKTALKALGEQV